MAATVDDYIRGFPKEIQAGLRKIRETVKKAAPGATEKMSYGMPTFVLNKNLVHFAAMKAHFGFYPTPSAIVAFEAELSPYKTSKGAVQFPFDEPLPLSLIQKIVKFRVKENTAPGLKQKTSARGPINVCSRGHEFRKTSDCPVCPKCWSKGNRGEAQSDFPDTLGAPALRALQNAKIKNLSQLSKWQKRDVADLHGMGPKGISMLENALKKVGLKWKASAKK